MDPASVEANTKLALVEFVGSAGALEMLVLGGVISAAGGGGGGGGGGELPPPPQAPSDASIEVKIRCLMELLRPNRLFLIIIPPFLDFMCRKTW